MSCTTATLGWSTCPTRESRSGSSRPKVRRIPRACSSSPHGSGSGSSSPSASMPTAGPPGPGRMGSTSHTPSCGEATGGSRRPTSGSMRIRCDRLGHCLQRQVQDQGSPGRGRGRRPGGRGVVGAAVKVRNGIRIVTRDRWWRRLQPRLHPSRSIMTRSSTCWRTGQGDEGISAAWLIVRPLGAVGSGRLCPAGGSGRSC